MLSLTVFLPRCRAILDMKNQRDKLHQYQRRITILTDKETDIAKQMLAKGDKTRALLALRRKKYQESLLAKTDAQLAQLEQLTSNVEFAQIQKDVVFGLQQGTKVLQEIHKEMGGIEHVEKLMGETADAVAYQKVSFSRSDSLRLESSVFFFVITDYGLVLDYRRSATCWAVTSRITRRKRSKTSSRHSRPRCAWSRKRTRSIYLLRQRLLCQRSKQTRNRQWRRGNNGRPCWQNRSRRTRAREHGSVYTLRKFLSASTTFGATVDILLLFFRYFVSL